MRSPLRSLRALSRDQRGASNVEFVVLLVLVCAMCLALWNQTGHAVAGKLAAAGIRFNYAVAVGVPVGGDASSPGAAGGYGSPPGGATSTLGASGVNGSVAGAGGATQSGGRAPAQDAAASSAAAHAQDGSSSAGQSDTSGQSNKPQPTKPAERSLADRALAVAETAAEVAIALTPIGDVQTLLDPNASTLDKTLATVGLVSSVVPGIGQAVKGTTAAIKAATTAAKVGKIAKVGDKVVDGAKVLSHGDEALDAVKAAENAGDALKASDNAAAAAAGAAGAADKARDAEKAAGAAGDAAKQSDDVAAASGKKPGCAGGACEADPTKMRTCFPAGTLVSTPMGMRPIEQLTEGDEVHAYDFEANAVVTRRIEQTLQRESYELVQLGIDGETIEATKSHPFWVEDRGWIEAGSLEPGMLLRGSDGDAHRLDHVGGRSGPVAVYNFSVEREHNYFVGTGAVLVHNESVPPVYTDFNKATNVALDWLRSQGVDTSKVSGPFLAKFGPHKGKPIGVRFEGGGYYRIEFDARSGAHVNVGVKKVDGPHIHFEGNQKTVNNLIDRLFRC